MTNGFDLAKVTTALFGRIGWRQPATGSPVITTANLETRSGRYFQDFHALVSVANVKATMEEAGASDNHLNEHLTNLAKAAIMKCLNNVFRVRDFIDQAILYTAADNQAYRTIPNNGLFVGYQINLARATDIALQINTAQLFFDSAATFNLYMFAEGKKAPIYTKSVTTTAGDVTVVDLDNWIINYIASGYAGNKFYIGYFQNDLGPAKAIQHDVCFGSTKVFSATPMQAAATGATEFDRTQISWTGQPYGFNLEVSAFRDHTNGIVKNAAQFDEAVGLTVTYSVIESILNSTQLNSTERILKEQMDRIGVQLELQGAAPISDGPKIKGIVQRLETEYERLRKSFYPKPKAQVINYACSTQ